MHNILVQLVADIQLIGDVARDVPVFLSHRGRPDTAVHCGAVAAEARRIAELAGADVDAAEMAGWLHDVSVIFPSEQRAVIAEQLGIEVLHPWAQAAYFELLDRDADSQM